MASHSASRARTQDEALAVPSREDEDAAIAVEGRHNTRSLFWRRTTSGPLGPRSLRSDGSPRRSRRGFRYRWNETAARRSSCHHLAMDGAPSLAGRLVERSVLTELVNDGGVVVMSGEPGSGKTTLLQWAGARATATGRRVVACRPAALEASISLSALSDLLTELTEDIAEMSTGERDTLRAVADGATRVDRSDARQAVTSLFAHIGEKQPLLVVIDDLQWIDDVSSEVLAYAIRRAVRGHAVVASFRTASSPALADALVRLQSARSLPLGPMSELELAEVAARMLGGPVPACLTISRLAGGSPLRATELARICRFNPEAILHLHHIATDVNPFRMSVKDWSTETLQILFAGLHLRDGRIDVLHEIFGTEAVSAVLREPRVRLLTNVNGRTLTAGHPLFVDAVSASLPLSLRSHTHAMIVDHVDDPVERARHLSLSDAPASLQAADQIMEGSRLAHDRGSTDLAHQLASRVADFLPSDAIDEQSRAQLWLAHMEYRQNEDAAAVSRLIDLVNSLPKSPVRTDAELMLANIEAWSFDIDKGVNRYLSVLADDDASATQRAGAATHLGILSLGGGNAGDALTLAELAVDLASSAEGQLLAEAEAILVAASFFNGHGPRLDLLDQALEREDLRRPLSLQGPPLQWAPFIWVWSGDRRATQGFVDRRRFLSGLGYSSALSLSLSIETRLFLESGHRDEAEQLVRRSREFAEFEHAIVDAMVSIAEARLRLHLGGDDSGAFERLDHADDYLNSMAFGFGWIESATVRMAGLARTDLPAAAAFGLEAFERHWDRGIVEPSIIPGIQDLIEALVVTRDPRSGEIFRLFDELPENRSDLQRLQQWRDACIEANRNGPNSSAGLVRFAENSRTVGDKFWAARAFLHAGRFERREGRRRDSRLLITEALALFEAIQASGWAAEATNELHRLEPRTKSVGVLTTNESQIALVASQGTTNKQIASQLFVSEKTVEAVLSSAYRKLGIARRGQLANALRDHGYTPSF